MGQQPEPDYYITTYCEYNNHGKYGDKHSPAFLFIASKCPNCTDPEFPFNICFECWDAPKPAGITCGYCYKSMEPSAAWTPLFRWF